jgi:hypothetical protein
LLKARLHHQLLHPCVPLPSMRHSAEYCQH